MNIVLIIPYFGKLPEWIILFLKSCEYLDGKIDFLFFTDDENISCINRPSNVKYYVVSFDWLVKYIETKGLGVLSSAYKLCDYKPLYGYIFQEYIEGYDYWGYCDIDTVLGDISSFLIKNNYTCYDRIGEKGHFTIYRNTKECRELFTQYPYSFPKYFDFEFVKQTTYPCHFDESGMNIICNRSNSIKYLEKNFALQTTIVRELHLHTFGAKYPELFVFNKGHIYRYEKMNDSIMKEEYMYIHFQDRKKMPIHNGCEDCFLITHLGFVPFSEEKIEDYFRTLYGQKYEMDFRLYFSDVKPRMAIFVSKLSHCLFDMLARYTAGEWNVEIPLIISNHPDLQHVAERFGIPFYLFPITKETKEEQERKEMELLAKHKITFIVLARYMQVISEQMINAYPNKIINIHHSFLPAFVGAKPYHAAFQRGVKIIGATSHYVTTELDAGPIIEQDVVRITHKDSIEDLVNKGKDLEKIVLSRAVQKHIERKVLAYKNKTVIFS